MHLAYYRELSRFAAALRPRNAGVLERYWNQRAENKTCAVAAAAAAVPQATRNGSELADIKTIPGKNGRNYTLSKLAGVPCRTTCNLWI